MAKFALNYNRINPYMDEVSEIIIKFHKSNNLLDFLKEHKDQRIVISIEDGLKFIKDGGIDYFKLIKQLNINNFILRFPSMFSDKSITKKQSEEIRAEKIPSFFNDYVDKWDVLYGYFDLGVKAVYIANELGFELDKVHEMAAEQGVEIRVLPNVAQSSWFSTPDLTKFFIRPEDIEDYEPYVDVFELYETNPGRPQIGEILYKAYAKDKKWFGKLNEIISNFDNDLDGRFTHPLWADRRLSCGKKCLKGARCRMCYTLAGLADTLKKVGITVEKEESEKPVPNREELEKLINEYYGADAHAINLDDILSDVNNQLDNNENK